MGRRPKSMTMAERFWEKVIRGDGCWIWVSAQKSRGYGAFGIKDKTYGAHRVAWELTYGPIPPDMQVLHACNTSLCVRPDHLYLGTVVDNMRDRDDAGHTRYGFREGIDHPNAKLTPEQIHEIRASAEGPTALARRFQVSKSLIWLIRTRKHYKNLQ